MFLEKPINKQTSCGCVEVICGSMFSGKTEELIRRLKRAEISGQKIMIFKPKIDVRYNEEKVVSHNNNSIPSTPVPTSANIILLSVEAQIVAIDEAQFFDDELPHVCRELAQQGKRVIVAGLDMDYTGNPFGPIPNLMATADHVTKVHAICMNCGNPALYSHRKTNNNSLVQLGEKEEYEPLCRACYQTKV
tara:strand:+ start:608 stop:1180 length:573 start_codon:yes stop_codon:yes gene_type:complete